jgi:PhnB protein
MNNHPLFNFIVEKEARTITVERSFNAPLDPVWAAWTEADILCKWWAPKPYECVIKALEFCVGGRWLYAMKGPEAPPHWAFFDYKEIRPKTYFAGTNGFCDEHGVPLPAMPTGKWENFFSEADGATLVRVVKHFNSQEEMEALIKMGFKEGFAMGLDQLDQLLAANNG